MRVGHAGKNIIQGMCDDPEYGMKVCVPSEDAECTTCNPASQTKSSMTGRLVCDDEDIVVHSDICGHFRTKTKGGCQYFATFVVGKSRYCDIALLKTRDEVRENLYNFIAWVERHSVRTVKRVHTDNAREYDAMEKNFKERGI